MSGHTTDNLIPQNTNIKQIEERFRPFKHPRINYNMIVDEEASLPSINNSDIDKIQMSENTAKRPCLSVTQNIPSLMTNNGCSPVTRSYNPDTLYIFDDMCQNVKVHGICKRYRCTHPHVMPVNWEITLHGMPKESLWNLYNNTKKGMKVYLFKKIFPIVVNQLGCQKDFNCIVILVKDILEINIDSDPKPYINAIINALRSTGMTFNDVIEFVFNSTFVTRNLKDLLAEILINIIMDQGDIENNWSAMKLLMNYGNYQLDDNLIKTILSKCLKKSKFQKALCLKVYGGLISRISDDKFGLIDLDLIEDYIVCMRTCNLSNEAQKLSERTATLFNVVLADKLSNTSTTAAPHGEEMEMFGMDAVKLAIFNQDLSQFMSLIHEYKEGDLTEEFLKTCLDAVHEGAYQFPVLFANLCQNLTVLQNNQDVIKDESLEYVIKTIGANLIIDCSNVNKWIHAYNIYQALRGLYNESEIINAKMIMDDKPSCIKRLLIICRLFVKKCDWRQAWELFKVNRLHTSSSWTDETVQQDVHYRDKVFIELMGHMNRRKQWETIFTIVEYIFKENIHELDPIVNRTIIMAVKNSCNLEYILSFMFVCPLWYNRVHCHTFRVIVVSLVRNHNYTIARTVYKQGCNMAIYPHFVGNEECLEISSHYVLDEVLLMLKVFLQNMINFMPVTHPLVIKVQQCTETTDGTGTQLQSLLCQNNMTCAGMNARIVNILNNYMKPPIRVVNKHSHLEISTAELEKHMDTRRTRNLFK